MLRRVIKYFFSLLFFINCTLLSQETENLNEQPAGYIEVPPNPTSSKKSIKEIYPPKITEENKIFEEINRNVLRQGYEAPSQNNKEESVFNVLSSSYRNNIRFGGFRDKYAIINFTPSVFIKPASFINFSANHNYSCFVPMDGIKEHIKFLFVQGAAVLAVDNTIKLFFGSEDVIPKIAGFVFKTLIITEVMKTINKNNSNPMYEHKTYRYSVSIRI
jgi:hypothetical protein